MSEFVMSRMEINGYQLSRAWFDFCFENPEIIRPIHTAIYFFSIEHCNRLGWKDKFGFPSQMVMEAVGVKNWRTYSAALNDIVSFGFITMIEVSKNQYSSNIISINATVKNTKAPTKALDKALQKHSTKQRQSTVSIDKQLNLETNKQMNSRFTPPDLDDVGQYMMDKGLSLDKSIEEAESFIDYYVNKDWKVGKANTKMKDWQAAVRNWLKNDFRKEKSFAKKEKNYESEQRQQLRAIAQNIDRSDY